MNTAQEQNFKDELYTNMVNAINAYYNAVNDDRKVTVAISQAVETILVEKGYSEEEIEDFNYY